jgi:undecaprenyl-diphosphatase
MKKEEKKLFYLSLISLILFILVLVLIKISAFQPIDIAINLELKDLNSPFLSQISKGIGYIFDPVTAIIISFLSALILWFKDSKKDAVLFASVAASAGILIYSLKELLQIARPENLIETSYSFPSGHAVFAVVLFGFLIYIAKKADYYTRKEFDIVFVILILFVGLSRLILGVHWLSDVLGGFFLGLSVLFSGFLIEKRLFGKGGR